MSDVNNEEEARSLYERIKTERDELKVQASLAKMELKDKWEETEVKWHHFSDKFDDIIKGSVKAGDDVAKGFTLLGHELKHAYEDLKESIKSKHTY